MNKEDSQLSAWDIEDIGEEELVIIGELKAMEWDVTRARHAVIAFWLEHAPADQAIRFDCMSGLKKSLCDEVRRRSHPSGDFIRGCVVAGIRPGDKGSAGTYCFQIATV
jgi:hypothetical protein